MSAAPKAAPVFAKKPGRVSETQSFLILLGVLMLVPFVTPAGLYGPALSIGSFTLIYLIAAQALNLQVGYTGLLNLGAVAFVGIGGYTAGILLAVPGGHKAAIYDVVALKDGQQCLSVSKDGSVRLWDIASGSQLRAYRVNRKSLKSMALSPDGKLVAAGGEGRRVFVWDFDSGELKNQSEEFQKPITALCFSADSQSLMVGHDDGLVQVLPVSSLSGKKLEGHYMPVRQLLRGSQPGQFYSVAEDRTVRLWDSLAGRQLKEWKNIKNGVRSMALFKDGERAILGLSSREAVLFNLKTSAVEHRYVTHGAAIEHVALSPDESQLLIGSRDKTTSLWTLGEPKLECKLEGHLEAVTAAVFSHSGKKILTCSTDRSVRLFSLKGEQEQILPVSTWALVAFYKRNLPSFSGNSRWMFFFLDPHFLAYMTVTPVAMLAAALMGLAIGVPTLRLRGDYFAIVTLGFAQIFQLIVRNEEWLTGGPSGLKGLPAIFSFAEGPDSIAFFRDTGHYFLGVFFFAITLLVMLRIRDSRMGRAFMAIRDDELAAQSNGIQLSRYKIYSFLISAMLAALAGIVQVSRVKIISPTDLLFWESILYLCCIVFGGLGSIKGAVFGAVLIGSLGEVMRQVLSNYPAVPAQARYIAFAVVLIVVMRYKPEGLFPAADEELERGTRERDRHKDVTPSLFTIGAKHGAA